jgi:hypothetical protein
MVIFKVDSELCKIIHGNGFPVISGGIYLFTETDIVDEGFDESKLTHFKLVQFLYVWIGIMICHVVNTIICQLDKTNAVINSFVILSPGDILFFKNILFQHLKGSLAAVRVNIGKQDALRILLTSWVVIPEFILQCWVD